MATTVIQRKKVETATPVRRVVMGLVFLALSMLILVLFALKSDPALKTTFVMNPGGIDRGLAPDWVLPGFSTMIVLTVITFLAAVYQIFVGFKKATNVVLGIVVALFIFAFLAWAAEGRSLNLGGMLSGAVLLSVPITLGAFSGVLCERSGVVNIAIEGMMLMGSMVGALVGSVTNSLLIGLIAAILASVLMAALHAVLSIKYKINQIVSGTVINIFATGLTTYISQKILQVNQSLNNPPIFPRLPIPILADIPVIGPILFNQNMFVYAMFILLAVLQISIFKTRWGLRLRAVGEHPKAADTLGINVIRTRYMAVLLGGAVAGFGGAFFTLGSVGRFDKMMTAGKGFIGLAAMIFGNWTPIGSFGAGLLFGFADSIATKLAILGSYIPPQFMSMAPYITTMVVLAGIVGRGQMPAADGEPYVKE
ncbi:MAG: ABC transporter permease [Chloroflexi bacterium 44-23]|nr:MAG: ABC transporter permease [Chloroflexi bacterium 44-23]